MSGYGVEGATKLGFPICEKLVELAKVKEAFSQIVDN
jgi:hypothetical protein